MRSLFILVLISTFAQAQLQPDGATASFRGSLPPKPTGELREDQVAQLKGRLAKLTTDFGKVNQHARGADAEIFLKAVRYALEFHEWYGKKPEDDFKKATALLDEAEKRIASLKRGETPWMYGSGQKVLGFYSKIDNSPQPYGVEIPEGLSFGTGKSSVPMWIWLHGRGDTDTDLHFVFSRLNAKKPGQFQPFGTIVIHPFGRYCNGWKSAGETDVFEARDDAIQRFNIDTNRIALAGFSMGGAGAWHIGAHFADQWACVHTGAGFVDVKRYQKLTENKMPPWYEQKLWRVYDVPNYARNFFNVPLVCYSGEVDPQRDSAEYMTEVLDKEGLHPPHLIGPGMGHKYHPDVIKDVQSRIEKAVASGRDPLPKKVVIQTRSLAYSHMHWLQIVSMKEQWEDTRAEAIWDTETNNIAVTTKNVSSLRIHLQKQPKMPTVEVDGESVSVLKDAGSKLGNEFQWVWNHSRSVASDLLTKKPMLQGPIDDGFKSSFIVVLPDGKPDGTASDKWARIEADHFLIRWRSLMRGDAIVRKATEVSDKDMRNYHLVLWGTPKSNSLLRRLLESRSVANILTWDTSILRLVGKEAPVSNSVPVFCYPNPMNSDRYIIVNSGLTFREVHDKTNSLQNPKLPDWALLDITEPPTTESAGKVIAADFFDGNWMPRVK
jgi:predicted esterase